MDTAVYEPAERQRWYERFPRALPVGIFALTSAVTLVSVFAIEATENRRRSEQLARTAQSISSALQRQADSTSAYLRSGSAVFATQQEVAGPLFQNFIGKLRLDTNYRGAEGIGWAMRVDKQDIPTVEAGMRRRGSRNFTIRPLPSDDQAYAVPVMYLQPETERNRLALGYNMYSEPARRAAMQAAERFDRPTATSKVVLVQEGPSARAPGFLIYMPVFGVGADGPRRLLGYVYSPFNAQRFLEAALALETPGAVGVKLYDGETVKGSPMATIPIEDPSGATVTERVSIANHEWTLLVESPRATTLTSMSLLTLLFGLLAASLLLVLARLLTRQAAEDKAALTWFEEQASIRNSLTRELNHRVKNTLANVLSIVALTRRRTSDLDSFTSSLEGRIRALSATHDLLTQSEWGTTPIRAVVIAELAPYAQASERALDISGPDVELAPNDALSLGLAIHELATNAAKYGALSVEQGKLAVTWQLLTRDLARIEWAESGGPPVDQQRKRGFGTDLIEKIVAHELQNPVDLRFEPGGVRCTLIIPVRQPAAFSIRAGR